MGPNTNDKELLKSLALNGMDIARFNFSHGDYEEQKGRLDLLKQIRKEVGLPIAALLDTKAGLRWDCLLYTSDAADE